MPFQIRFLHAFLVFFAAAASAEKLHYEIYTQNEKLSGAQTVDRQANGVTKVKFVYKDNGRGPELNEEFRLSKDGTMTEYKVTGTSTFGSAVSENFSIKKNQAEWQSTFDKGNQKVSGPTLYVPVNGSFEYVSASITSLSRHKSLNLVPSGVLTQRKVDEVTFKGKKFQLLAQTGIGLSPSFYWATTGASPRLFAVIYPGYLTVVEKGWLPIAKTLTERQRLAEGKLLRELSERLQHQLSGVTVLRNVRVFNSETAALSAPSDVHVLRGNITAVLPTGAPIKGAKGVIEGNGRVLLPGLYDMHAHIGRWEGGLHLAAGVTTIRDLGNNNDEIQEILEEYSAGKLLAPQIVTAGFLEGESEHSANGGFVIKDLEGAKNAIDWYNEHGYPQLKIYNSFPRALVRETVAYAHSRGMRVSGHVPAFMRAQEVVEQGFDEIQHINQVLLNFLVQPDTDTRTLARFYLPAEKLAGFDFNSKPVKDFIALLKKNGTVIDPTVTVFNMIEHRDGEIPSAYASIADHLPPDVKRGMYASSMKIPDDITAERYKKSYLKMIEFVGQLYRAGIPIVAGTDGLAGFTLQSELEAYVTKAGLTPAQALQIATLNGAKYTRTSSDRGSISAGKKADLVLIDGDPTQNISDIRKIALVITNNKLIYPTEIYKTLGVKPFVESAPQLQPIEIPAPARAKAAGSATGH